MSRTIFDSFVDARAFMDRDALAERVQRLALWAITAFDALSVAFRINRNIVARPGAAVAAHLVRLAATAVNT